MDKYETMKREILFYRYQMLKVSLQNKRIDEYSLKDLFSSIKNPIEQQPLIIYFSIFFII